MTFDIWVITKPDWRLSVIGGTALSTLVDTKYAIQTDDKGNKTFIESPTGQDSRHTDIMALANVFYSGTVARTLNFGAAFGIGSSGTSPRFFLGPSVVFGKYFVFTGGWSVGSITAPPVGQAIGTAPVNGDNTLNSLSRRVVGRPFFGIGFTWIDRRDQFAAALAAAASASGSIGSCVSSVKPDAVTIDETGKVASSAITVEAGDDCTWAATLRSGGTDFAVDKGSGKGKGTLKATAAIAVPGGRNDTLDVIGPFGSVAKSVKLSQAPGSCVKEILSADATSEGLSFMGAITPKTVQVRADETCDWTLTFDPSAAGFKADKEKAKGTQTVTVTPPAISAQDQTTTLRVIGPANTMGTTLILKQPRKQ